MRRFVILFYIIIVAAFIAKLFISIYFPQLNYSGDHSKAQPQKKIVQYDINIDLEENKLYLFENGNLLKSYAIASGKLSTPSPVGIWKIVEKSDWGEGFGGSWMGLSVPWGKYGIHGTSNPGSIGSNASGGCFRMFSESAAEVYNIVPVGTTVVVTKGPYGAIGKTHRIPIPGDRGSDVYTVQMALKNLGFYKGNLDGYFGDDLKNSLFALQKSKGVEPHNEVTTSDLKLMGIFPFE